MNLVRALNHHFVFALESSRTVALSDADRAQGRFQPVQSLVFATQPPARLFARRPAGGARHQTSLHKPRRESGCVVSGQQRYRPGPSLIDRDLPETVESGRIPQVAQTERLDGQGAHQDVATQATHFFAAVLAYTKLAVLKLKCGIGHFRLKAQLYTVGLKAMYHQLGQIHA